MKIGSLRFAAALCAAATLTIGAAAAEPKTELVIDGEVIPTRAPSPEGNPLDELLSGWLFRSEETQQLEEDDFGNPAMVLVDQAADTWGEIDGSEGKSCESCHDEVEIGMVGVRAGYPKWKESAKRPFTLENQINECRETRMGAEPWKWESVEMLGMTALVGLQSRGMPVNVDSTGPMQSWHDTGKELYYTRVGQLDMSCA
ncbi:MAG: sulfur oxidation c-type cytochrome SoxA, partial [Alphaproteobacteria bacterium]